MYITNYKNFKIFRQKKFLKFIYLIFLTNYYNFVFIESIFLTFLKSQINIFLRIVCGHTIFTNTFKTSTIFSFPLAKSPPYVML